MFAVFSSIYGIQIRSWRPANAPFSAKWAKFFFLSVVVSHFVCECRLEAEIWLINVNKERTLTCPDYCDEPRRPSCNGRTTDFCWLGTNHKKLKKKYFFWKALAFVVTWLKYCKQAGYLANVVQMVCPYCILWVCMCVCIYVVHMANITRRNYSNIYFQYGENKVLNFKGKKILLESSYLTTRTLLCFHNTLL